MLLLTDPYLLLIRTESPSKHMTLPCLKQYLVLLTSLMVIFILYHNLSNVTKGLPPGLYECLNGHHFHPIRLSQYFEIRHGNEFKKLKGLNITPTGPIYRTVYGNVCTTLKKWVIRCNRKYWLNPIPRFSTKKLANKCAGLNEFSCRFIFNKCFSPCARQTKNIFLTYPLSTRLLA